MSKTVLIGVIAAAVLGVGTIAAVTATVIVDDEDGGELVVHSAPVPAPQQGLPPLGRGHGGRLFRFGPGVAPGPFRELRGCLRRHGLGGLDRGSPPAPGTLRDALRDCGSTLPEFFPARPPTR